MLENQQTDGLTDFFLKQSLKPYLEGLIGDAAQQKRSFSVVMIDLDHFKRFNDKYGHLFGDEILKYTSSTLRLTFSSVKCNFFRYGGDEFVAVLPERGPREALQSLNRCYYNFANRPFLFNNKFYKIHLSCGVASFPVNGKTPEELIKRADEAMYYSKRHGRNHAILASSLKYLKLRGQLTIILIVLLIAAAPVIFYRSGIYEKLQPTIKQIKGLKVVTKNLESPDKIILKNGTIIEGRILNETPSELTFGLSLNKGEASTVFSKSEIAKIERGAPALKK